MIGRPLVFAALLALLTATVGLPAPAAEDSWLEEDFSGAPTIFNRVIAEMKPLADGHQGSGARSVIPKEGHWGSSGHWEFSEHGLDDPEELYWRYWIKFPDGFYIEPRNRGKLPGPSNIATGRCRGNDPSTPSDPCWSARMMFSRNYAGLADPDPNGPDDQTLLGFYVYNLDSPSDRGDIWDWNENVALLDHGKWYCVEGRIDLNTPGEHDGILQGWVDGAPAFDRSGIAFRRANEGELDVDSFWFDIYYGGDASVKNMEIHFDSLALGPDRLGCDDAPVPAQGTFADDDHSVHQADIEELAAAGITKGCNPPANTLFCPEQPVTRGQMAAFLTRALNLSAGTATYTDTTGHLFEPDIGALATAGITKGCNPPANTLFCPEQPVTRAQMATFLVRAGLTD